MDKRTDKKYEPLEASIKHGHIHCYLSAKDMNAFTDKMDDLEIMVRQHIEDGNLTCIAVKLDTDGLDIKNDIFYGDVASMLLGIYEVIEAENMSRPEKDVDGEIKLLVECDDSVFSHFAKQKPKAEYLRRLGERKYLKHVGGCGLSYQQANQIERMYDKSKKAAYARQKINLSKKKQPQSK